MTGRVPERARTMIALDDVLSRVESVRRAHRGWMGRCPAHADRRASLSIRARDDGRGVLLHCFAGCTYDEITSTLGCERTERTHAAPCSTFNLALTIARRQPWAREDVALNYTIAAAIRRRRRAVDIARDAATRAGDRPESWALLARAARMDVEADAIEAELEDALQ